jgi:hypothetical protein
MAPARAAAYLGGAVLLAAWLASAASVRQQAVRIPMPRLSPDEARLDVAAADVQAQATRLRQRLAAAPAPQAPIRNPFAFAAHDRPARATAAPRVQPPLSAIRQETVAWEPELALLGVAEDNTPSGIRRTALIGAADDELIMAVEGETVAGRYRVTGVGADAVELTDLTTGATRRLALRSPVSPL